MKHPNGSRLVAVWPGIGQVALTAGFYLMSKLRMREEKPPRTGDLFDLDHLDVDRGLARASHVPEDHLFACEDFSSHTRLNLMIAEGEPTLHGLEYCRRIVDRAEKLGVSQVVTFAAVAADSHPREPSKVLGVATQVEGLDILRRAGIQALEAGQIMGMNGLFLAAAAERGIPGLCLMGVMPAMAASIPYPKAAFAVLEAFTRMAELDIDLRELEDYGRLISQKLTTGLQKLREVLEGQASQESSETGDLESDDGFLKPEAAVFGPEERRKIEALFQQAAQDPSKAFELKRELDRLNVFKQYENRFLDLFRSGS